jgi:hypothetical protein
MGLDSRAVVDEIGDFMRAYETRSWISRATPIPAARASLNMDLSKQRADAVKNYLVDKFHFPPPACAPSATAPTGPSPTTTLRRAARRIAAPTSRCTPTG